MLKNMKKKVKGIFAKTIREKRGKAAEGQISLEELKKQLRNNPETILIDVRSPQEYQEGHLNGSINIPLYELASKVNQLIPNNQRPIILYCKTGARSEEGRKLLKQRGYKTVYNLEGGLDSN